MADTERVPSKTVPVLIAVLISDTAVTDPSTGKKSLIGIFDRIWAATFPIQRALSIYVKLTDAEGFYRFKLKFLQTGTGQAIAEVEGEADIKDRLASNDFFVPMPPLPIPGPGRYEIQVWFNEVFLGSTFLDAIPQSEK